MDVKKFAIRLMIAILIMMCVSIGLYVSDGASWQYIGKQLIPYVLLIAFTFYNYKRN